MTDKEMMDILLKNLDKCWEAYRERLAAPDECNELCPKYREAAENLGYAAKKIIALKQSFLEVESVKKKME